MIKNKVYWFPAKSYGLGWGPPVTWQGWVVLAVFILSMIVDSIVFTPDKHMLEFLGVAGGITVGLLLVCWLKGEPLKWRWGDESVRK